MCGQVRHQSPERVALLLDPAVASGQHAKRVIKPDPAT
jgi:hypothetical protein